MVYFGLLMINVSQGNSRLLASLTLGNTTFSIFTRSFKHCFLKRKKKNPENEMKKIKVNALLCSCRRLSNE